MKREDEEYCKTRFDSFVKRLSPPAEVVWKEVAQEEEPPDYYLFLRNAKFAIEVTTLMEKVPVGTSSLLPRAEIRTILSQFVRQVHSSARTAGHLRGNYVVWFPRAIDDFAGVQNDIRQRLLEYVCRTAKLETAPWEIVFQRSIPRQFPQRCDIHKVNCERDLIAMGGPQVGKWEDEVAHDICSLLNKSLNTKAEKLKTIAEPWILLLLDKYHLADSLDYQRCARGLATLSSFHTVFVLQRDEPGFILHSHNGNWLEA